MSSELRVVPLPQALEGFGFVLASGHSSLSLSHRGPFGCSPVPPDTLQSFRPLSGVSVTPRSLQPLSGPSSCSLVALWLCVTSGPSPVALSHRGASGGSAFPPGPPAPLVVAAPPSRGSVFSQPRALPSVRLFSLVLVTLSDCSGRSSQVSLFSAITTLFFKQIPLRLSLSDRLKVVPFPFLV